MKWSWRISCSSPRSGRSRVKVDVLRRPLLLLVPCLSCGRCIQEDACGDMSPLCHTSPSNMESCGEDDGEEGDGVVEEDLVDRPGNTNGTQFDILQSILLPFLMRCGF